MSKYGYHRLVASYKYLYESLLRTKDPYKKKVLYQRRAQQPNAHFLYSSPTAPKKVCRLLARTLLVPNQLPMYRNFEYHQNEFAADVRWFWCKADEVQKKITETQSVEVYLPKGESWYDFWTGEKFDGGQHIQREAPIDIMPLYIQAGSIIPMGPIVQFSNEKPEAPIELKIYTGADGQITIYEDEGENYNYEKGAYCTIPISWNEKNRKLTIDNRNGEFNAMVKNRTFKVVLVNKDHGVGLDEEDSINKTITYKGKKMIINF